MIIFVLGSTVFVAVGHLFAATGDLQHSIAVAALALSIHPRVLIVLEYELAIIRLLLYHYQIKVAAYLKSQLVHFIISFVCVAFHGLTREADSCVLFNILVHVLLEDQWNPHSQGVLLQEVSKLLPRIVLIASFPQPQ